jgi:hypothetical protein
MRHRERCGSGKKEKQTRRPVETGSRGEVRKAEESVEYRDGRGGQSVVAPVVSTREKM